MTLVTIDLGDVAGGHDPDDHVVIRAEAFRESPGGGVTSTAEVLIPLVDGVGQAEVEPGPVVVAFRCRAVADTREKRGVVPDAGPVGIEDVIGGAFEYAPPVVNRGLDLIEGARDEALGQVGDAAVALKDEIEAKAGKLDYLEPAGKNLFNPETDVVTGEQFRADGTTIFNGNYSRTIRYPIAPGQPVSLSGLGTVLSHNAFRFMHFWDANDELIVKVDLPHGNGFGDPRLILTDEMTEIAPAGAASFSINLATLANTPLPERLQIEISPKPTPYLPYHDLKFGVHKDVLDEELTDWSEKNLLGRLWYSTRLSGSSIQNASSVDDVTTDFIPVEYGKTYTISGMDPSLVTLGAFRRVGGFSSNRSWIPPFVKGFPAWSEGTYTFTVDDPAVKFIVVQLSYAGYGGSSAAVDALPLQVEVGPVATAYDPPQVVRGGRQLLENDQRILEAARDYTDQSVAPGGVVSADFTPMNEVADGRSMIPAARSVGPMGPTWEIQGETVQDAAGNTLTARVSGVPVGERAVYADIRVRDSSGTSQTPRVTVIPFNVPSGQLLHEAATTDYGKAGPLDDYVHPSIAYSATPVAGYKYWMVASAYPINLSPGVNWEDEEVFVSNDAKTWLRVKSAYETARTDTAPGMSLPEHSLVTSGGRRHAFLPSPAVGDTLEISVPDSPRGPAIDRQTVTITNDGGLPWKHDPTALIDGGYVYVYHSFHLPITGRTGGQNRFIVLTRTSDGINWEGVRADGSTWPVNATTTLQMFTKDAQGRYNYFWYPGVAGSNPEVIKWGDNDYEFYYGSNFATKYKGTSPWSFSFNTPITMQEVASVNHPGLLRAGNDLYQLNQLGLYKSADRGLSWTALDYHPGWKGGATGSTYKKALCLGEGGKVIIADVAWTAMSSAEPPTLGIHNATQRRNKLLIQEHPSLAAFLEKATGGLNDGYLDVQIDQINPSRGTRKSYFIPWVGNTSTTSRVNAPHQRVKITDLTVTGGDVLYIYATLMSRTGGSVSVTGIDIA